MSVHCVWVTWRLVRWMLSLLDILSPRRCSCFPWWVSWPRGVGHLGAEHSPLIQLVWSGLVSSAPSTTWPVSLVGMVAGFLAHWGLEVLLGWFGFPDTWISLKFLLCTPFDQSFHGSSPTGRTLYPSRWFWTQLSCAFPGDIGNVQIPHLVYTPSGLALYTWMDEQTKGMVCMPGVSRHYSSAISLPPTVLCWAHSRHHRGLLNGTELPCTKCNWSELNWIWIIPYFLGHVKENWIFWKLVCRIYSKEELDSCWKGKADVQYFIVLLWCSTKKYQVKRQWVLK